MPVLTAVAGKQLGFIFVHSSATTGLTLTDFAIEAVDVGDVLATPKTELAITVTELDDVDLPGAYRFLLTPTQRGDLFVRLASPGNTQDFSIQVADEAIDLVGHVYRDGTADATLTVTDGTDPIEGVSVTVYSDSIAISQGMTSAAGTVVFTLPTGTYTVRYRKSGYTFESDTLTVQSSDYNAPVLDEILPGTGSTGDFIVLRGYHFNHASSVVLFDGVTQAVLEKSADGRAILVEIPAGIVNTAVAVKVQKPHPTSGTLTSNTLTMVRT